MTETQTGPRCEICHTTGDDVEKVLTEPGDRHLPPTYDYRCSDHLPREK